MAESPGTVLKHGVRGGLAHFRILDGDEAQDDESTREYAHGDVEYQVYVSHLGAGGDCSHQSSYEHGCQCSRQGIQRAANEVELVASVATASQQIEHGIDNGVEQANAESRHERAQQVDIKARHALRKTGEVLYEHAHESCPDAQHGGLLVAYLGE